LREVGLREGIRVRGVSGSLPIAFSNGEKTPIYIASEKSKRVLGKEVMSPLERNGDG